MKNLKSLKEFLKLSKNIRNISFENQEVLSERELMIEGKTYRPDRMVKIDDAWFIIDFKTGNPSEKHQKQIDLYQKAMENLGRKIGGAELIYL